MKAMKKITVLLLIAALMASAAIPALAADFTTNYAAPATVTANGGKTTIDHNMQLIAAPYQLPHTIRYTFAVSGTATIKEPSSPTGLTVTDFVTGTPKFTTGKDSVEYGPNDDFTAAPHTITKTVEADWDGVAFKEPGTYYWTVSKTISRGTADSDKTTNLPSDNQTIATTYLWAHVVNDGTNGLKVANTGLSNNDALTQKGITDQYPADKANLTVSKNVAENHGSQDQYFKFTIKVKLPNNVTKEKYTIGGNWDTAEVVNKGPYNKNSNAVQPVDVDAGVAGTQIELDKGDNEIVVWLRHGQNVVINGLPFSATYEVVESENTGYNAMIANSDNEATVDNAAFKTSGTIKNTPVTAAYTNKKTDTPPTGILLQVGAPLTGLVLAAALLSVILATKRRKEQETK